MFLYVWLFVFLWYLWRGSVLLSIPRLCYFFIIMSLCYWSIIILKILWTTKLLYIYSCVTFSFWCQTRNFTKELVWTLQFDHRTSNISILYGLIWNTYISKQWMWLLNFMDTFLCFFVKYLFVLWHGDNCCTPTLTILTIMLMRLLYMWEV